MSALISVDMEDREWMYSGRPSASQISEEWITKTLEFLEIAFDKNHGVAGTWCPCSKCKNQRNQTKDDMGLAWRACTSEKEGGATAHRGGLNSF